MRSKRCRDEDRSSSPRDTRIFRTSTAPSASRCQDSVNSVPWSSSVSTTKTISFHPDTRCASIGPTETIRFSPNRYSSTMARSKLMNKPSGVCEIFSDAPVSRNMVATVSDERFGRRAPVFRVVFSGGIRIPGSGFALGMGFEPGSSRSCQRPDKSAPGGTTALLAMSSGRDAHAARTRPAIKTE